MSENKKGMALDDDVLENVTGGWFISTNVDGSGGISGYTKDKNEYKYLEFTPETKQEAMKWAVENLKLEERQKVYYDYMMSQNAENK